MCPIVANCVFILEIIVSELSLANSHGSQHTVFVVQLYRCESDCDFHTQVYLTQKKKKEMKIQ